MLKRKMLDKLIAWKQKAGGREALLIEGARRVGKSTIVEEFGRTQYKSYILRPFAVWCGWVCQVVTVLRSSLPQVR